jgi:hypothetical protein
VLENTKYFAIALEKGKFETYHHHILLTFPNAIEFSTLKKFFPFAHIEVVKSTPQKVLDYLGKANLLDGGLKTYGIPPAQGKRNDLNDIYEMMLSGNNLAAIRNLYPSQYIKYKNNINQTYQELLDEEMENRRIHKHVTYIYGSTGTGKTRYVMDLHGDKNVYRITNYKNPFDLYRGQDVIIFEEFRSSLKLQDMLNYLDIYPLRLPARYADRVAAYTKVYIISNISLLEQYKKLIYNHPLDFQAFLRRIDEVHLYLKDYNGNVIIEKFDDPTYILHLHRFNKKLHEPGFQPGYYEQNKKWFDENYDHWATKSLLDNWNKLLPIKQLLDDKNDTPPVDPNQVKLVDASLDQIRAMFSGLSSFKGIFKLSDDALSSFDDLLDKY